MIEKIICLSEAFFEGLHFLSVLNLLFLLFWMFFFYWNIIYICENSFINLASYLSFIPIGIIVNFIIRGIFRFSLHKISEKKARKQS